jgi:DnaK suppressor protein
MDRHTIEERLLQERSNLITRMMESSKEVHHRPEDETTDFSEQAMEIDNLDVLFKIDKASKHELHKINNALNRLSCNEYNICISCGKTISDKRLTALPCTDQCIDCA